MILKNCRFPVRKNRTKPTEQTDFRFSVHNPGGACFGKRAITVDFSFSRDTTYALPTPDLPRFHRLREHSYDAYQVYRTVPGVRAVS